MLLVTLFPFPRSTPPPHFRCANLKRKDFTFLTQRNSGFFCVDSKTACYLRLELTNRMWFSVVCTVIDNDMRYHSGQNTKHRPKYVRKMYFMRFHLFFLGDLTSRKGQREIRSISGIVGIGAIVLVNAVESLSHQFKSIHNRLFLP